jgi:hypothetical protein
MDVTAPRVTADAPSTDLQSTPGITRRAALRLGSLFGLPRMAGGGQPRPLHALVYRLRMEGGFATLITRIWLPGRISRCRLCRRCTAKYNVCMVIARGIVPKGGAEMFSKVGADPLLRDGDGIVSLGVRPVLGRDVVPGRGPVKERIS